MKVSVTQGGREAEVARLATGSFFGEMSLFTGEKRNATVTALRDTRVLVLSHAAFGRVLQGNAALADDFARVLEKRQRERAQTLENAAKASEAAAQDSHGTLAAMIRRFFGL